MTIVDGMILTAFFLPVVLVGWEECVGISWGIVDLRETETVGNLQGLTLDRSPTDDIDILLRRAVFQGFFQ